jgi:hypothetical protein
MTKETLRKSFSVKRTALLVKNRILEDFPGIAIALGILAGINLLGIIFTGRAVTNDSRSQVWMIFICLTGLLLTGMAFKGMHDGRSGTDWILLPATSLEKYASGLVTYLLILPLALALAATALSAILSLVELIAGGPGGRIWNPILAEDLKGWIDYATIVLVLAAGSATFRKRATIKTFGVTIAYLLVSSAILLGLVVLLRSIRGLPLPFLVPSDDGIKLAGDISIGAGARHAIDLVLNIVRYALVPGFSLLYGYLRVAEKEARDEVQ